MNQDLLELIRRCWLPVDDLQLWEVNFLIGAKCRLEDGKELNPAEIETLHQIERTYSTGALP